MTFLYKCKITIFNDTYNLNCIGTNGDTRTLVFRGSEKGFKLFLQRVKATDNATSPRSAKNRTYQTMIDTAKDGSDPFVYIYSHMLPKQNVIKESYDRVYHCSSEKIIKIRKDGPFEDCLFFANKPYSIGGCTYLYSLRTPSVIEVSSFFYQDDSWKLNDIVKEIIFRLGVTEQQAQDLLDSSIQSWEFSNEIEDNFWIQTLQGQSGKLLGYEGALSYDEQGAVYIIPMFGREQDLKLERIKEQITFFESDLSAKEYLDNES